MYIANGWVTLVVAVLLILVAIFLNADTDLPLYFSSPVPPNGFDGEVVWIVGASSGIGAGLAEDLTASGATVVLSARRVDNLNEVAKKTDALGRQKAFVLPMDILDLESHQKAYDEIVARYGRVDTIVLNAGMSQRQLAVDAPLETTRKLMELNFFSYISLTKVVLPDMLARKSGKIVVTSSLSGIMGTTIASSYSASKFALHGYFNALRSEVAIDNIVVSIVCPGPVVSEITSKSFTSAEKPLPTSKETRMSTKRCTELMTKGMYHNFEEMWIAHQPFLLSTYIVQYFPALSRKFFSKVVGPARMKALKTGSDVFNLKVTLGLE